ncbi:glycine betaine ABC transporter substrate-binding protein [Nocardioides deserti]|uniref:Glycine betaine ABC transporter substrate-binding protein n=1 Tax=Nocardioides deserti TaxID=1588644 RepID=A0ABR6U681_9ACTN|nr:glycine betaine ABC transporter substrate-binding protein [Nocardioides deserti]MBC2959351.1 glycine betaine ABC transporter substrate-binding protein [Nocardioides deserti]GGO73240.1 glycine/betaine ABC transporter substrate-binding protein [Nocardioides deserti]
MNSKRALRRAVATASLLTLGATAAACGSDDASDDDTTAGSGGGDKTINLGIIPSWTDGLSTAHLWKNVLEDEGYEVEITEISEAAPLYTGVANGDIDVYPSAWPQVTHEAYMEQFGEDLEDLGAYYEGAKLTFAVPEYSDLTSIADLKGKAGEYDGEIIGIEPGAGLTKVTKESVMPTYGLDEEFELVESSTTAMLAELRKATDAEEPIVVTLWKPFWANSEFPVKDLEDPEGALGEAETLNAIATAGFSEEHPEVAEMMGNLTLDDDQYGSLENLVVNEYGEGREDEAVEAWLEENPDVLEALQG